MMPRRSVRGRLSSHSTKRSYVRRLSSKLEMRLSAWDMQFVLLLTILASNHIKEPTRTKCSISNPHKSDRLMGRLGRVIGFIRVQPGTVAIAEQRIIELWIR
jgi:hypothetical protein